MMAEGDIRDPHARRAVALVDRADLEDKHLKLMEENQLLKKHARSQEEKMKKMATKLLRLTADEKKEAKRDGQSLGAVHLHHDVEVGEVVGELRERVRELEKHNTTLKNKVLLLRQQLETKGMRHTPYDHVQPRISTGLSKRGQKSASTEDVSMRKRCASSQRTAAALPRYGHSLLEDARRDNLELEELVLQLKQEVAVLTAEVERDQEQFKLQALQHEEEKLKLQQQLQVQLTAVQKSSIHDDVELIKLQRELREKSIRLQSLQSQFLTLERNLEVMKASHAKVLQEMEALNAQLREEQSRNSRLQLEVEGGVVSQQALTELQEMVADLRAEKELLKQTNERLVKSTLETDKDKEAEHKTQVRALQDRIKQLETTARENISAKAKVFDKLSSERELSEKLDGELRELRASHCQLQKEHQQLQEKMKFFSKESSVDWGEVEEALLLVKEGRGKGKESGKGKGAEPLPFLEKVEEEDKAVDYHHELQELRSSHADTISELEKTRRLLALQHTINKDYKKEVESLKSQLGNVRCEYEGRLQEYAQLLDIKAAHIKKLEGQLRNIAYGTRQYKVDTSKFEYGGGSELEESVELERGQNLLQFHVTQITLSSEALSRLNTSSPALFLTFDFLDFETQVTPVVQGPRPLFSFTSNFVVTMNDTFLHHLQKGLVSVGVHQALGMQHQMLATGSVKCRELLLNGGGKVHGKIVLTGVDTMQQCVNVGNMEYWVKLKQPITQAARLYQERSKALSLINQEAPPPEGVTTPATAVSHPQGTDYNELAVTITRCTGLKARDPAYAPSPYVMYKFYSFPDHDTEVLSHSSSPAFNNTKHFPLSMGQHLDHYLRTENLEVYVFDDLDSEETSYLGVAEVSLLPLAEGEHIQGKFQLTTPSGSPAGFVQLSLKWKHPYHTQNTVPSPGNANTNNNETPHVNTSTVPSHVSMERPPSHVPMETPSNLVSMETPSSCVAMKTSSNHVTTKTPSTTTTAVEMVSTREASPKKLTNLGSLTAEATKKATDDNEKLSSKESERGEACDTGDSVSVTVTECSVEEEEEEEVIEESLSGEDTMFEETIPQPDSTAVDDELSALSEHSSDEQGLPPQIPTHSSVIMVEGGGQVDEDDDSLILTPSEAENGNPITSTTASSPNMPPLSPPPDEDTISITIESFSVEPGSSLADDPTIAQLFVEYQFLSFNYGDLETITVAKPPPGQSAVFNLKTVFKMDATQKDLLLKPPAKGRVVMTVVSDPDDQQYDCIEVGNAEIDLNTIVQRRKDLLHERIEVLDLESDDDPEVMGYLTVSVEAWNVLQQLVKR